MTAADLVAALDLPPAARVDQRVPKTLLTEHGAPTTGDKRHIQEGIEEARWLAALKSTTVGVPVCRDEVREYLEIAVLGVTLRAGARMARIVELIHRAIPYPVLLVATLGDNVALSMAHKRWSQGEAGATVLDGDVVSAELDFARDDTHKSAFLGVLALSRQPRGDLYGLYQGWLNVLVALQAARATGAFSMPESSEQAMARQEALRDCGRLDVEIARLRAAAAKERQVARQVALNLELKNLELVRQQASANL
ncbi:MAG: DUF4391 domain-containing protein [Betaproteobacteria bacterium]